MVGEKKNRGEWKRAGPLTSRNLPPSLSLTQPFFFSPLSVSVPYLPIPSNYSNEWLRARQRRRKRVAVRDWEDRWGRDGRRRFITAFFICIECHSSSDPVLIGQGRLTAGTRCQDPEWSVLSYWLCERWCVGKWAHGLKWKCCSEEAALIQSNF